MVTSTLAADKNTWNNLSYSQQQEILKANPKLQWALSSLWLTVKSNTPVSVLWGTYDPNKQLTIWWQPVGNQKSDWQLEAGTSGYAGNNNNNNNSLLWGTYDPNRQLTIWWQPIGNTNQRGDWSLQSWTWGYWGTNNNTKSPIKVQSILGWTYDPNKQLTIWGKPITPAKQETPVTTPNTPKKTNTNTNVNRNTGGNNYVSPQQQQWDYQDNSQARLDQIADNLNKYKVTNPELFKDYDTFWNFFIDWKGRSADQIRFLDSWYSDYKQNEKYNNMTPDEVGNGIANGTVPEDYINTASSTDPARAEAIKTALKDAQDWIANESYLSELAGLSWFQAWNRKEMLYRDANNDWLDDRLYHEPTEEEKKLVNENSELEAERLKLSNAMKDLQSDLTNQYPDADLSTIMLLTSDRWNKIQKSLDTLNVTQTKVQWTIKYLQTERDAMDKAGLNTISELQKNYWIYMEYSPEGIKERTKAEYEATNITLDQADSWDDTDKQMALDRVLQWYYDKYGSIIQRSKWQVINDVIAHAKKNWQTLSQALEENFLKPLREKPQFASISAGNQASWVQWTKIGKDADWNDVYWFVNTDTMTVSPYWNIWWNYTPEQINTNRSKRVEAMANMARNYNTIWDMANAIADGMKWMWDWELECWVYTNDYINAVTWTKWWYGSSISSKIAQTNNDSWEGIQVWDAIVFDYTKNTPQWVLNSKDKQKLLDCWHVWFVTGVNKDWSVTISHTNGWVVTETTIAPWSDFYKCFAGSQHIAPNKNAINWYNEQFEKEYEAYFKKTDDINKLAKSVWLSAEEFREQANRYSWSKTASIYYDVLDTINWIIAQIDDWTIPSFAARKNALDKWVFGWLSSWDSDVADWYSENDRILSVLSLDSLIKLKWQWATFWALSDSEREAIGWYATKLWNAMSDDKYRTELVRLKNELIKSSHWYLSDTQSNQDYDWTAWI